MLSMFYYSIETLWFKLFLFEDPDNKMLPGLYPLYSSLKLLLTSFLISSWITEGLGLTVLKR